MKSIFTILLLGFFATNSLCQVPVRQWASFFNGSLTGKDEASAIITDTDGSVLVTGISYHTFNKGNFTTVKYDSSGNQVWADHQHNTQQSSFNGGKKLIRDKWGNFYAVGTLAVNDGDLAIIKYGPGGRLWTKSYEPYYMSSYNDFGVDIGTDSSGNIYSIAEVMSIGGNMEDLYIMKCDSSGTKIWDYNYSAASGGDYPRSLAVSPSGNAYPILSAFNFFGSATYDLFTIKFLSNGNQDWISKYNGVGNVQDFPSMIDIDASENTYVCGISAALTGDDMVFYKQNIYGTRLWTVTYDGTANENDTAVSIRRLPNNLVAATGSSRELINGVVRNCMVTMLIDSGTVLWTRKFFGTDSLGATPTGMIIDDAGNMVICGFEETQLASGNGMVLCYDPLGNIVWSDSYDGPAGLADKFNAITKDAFNNILVTGQSFSTGTTNADYLTVKYGYGTPLSVPDSPVLRFHLYPNPANVGNNVNFIIPGNIENVILKIYTIEGKLINTMPFSPGENIQFPASHLNRGVYLIMMDSTEPMQPVKLIVQ